MQNVHRKRWVALAGLLRLAPATFSVQEQADLRRGNPKRPHTFQTQPVPEDGNSLSWDHSLGAILVRSRVTKPNRLRKNGLRDLDSLQS